MIIIYFFLRPILSGDVEITKNTKQSVLILIDTGVIRVSIHTVIIKLFSSGESLGLVRLLWFRMKRNCNGWLTQFLQSGNWVPKFCFLWSRSSMLTIGSWMISHGCAVCAPAPGCPRWRWRCHRDRCVSFLQQSHETLEPDRNFRSSSIDSQIVESREILCNWNWNWKCCWWFHLFELMPWIRTWGWQV